MENVLQLAESIQRLESLGDLVTFYRRNENTLAALLSNFELNPPPFLLL